MDLKVITLENKSSGTVKLSDAVFGCEPRADILQRMVRWQLAKKQAGTHKTKQRAEIARTGAKQGNQKGGGRARHGSARPGIFRGGGKAHGPVVRSHAHGLTKKFRALGLKTALSSKAQEKAIIVVDDFSIKSSKTKDLLSKLDKLGVSNALFIDGNEVNKEFGLAARNIPNIDVLPVQGINVFDVLKRHTLVLSQSALKAIEERFQK